MAALPQALDAIAHEEASKHLQGLPRAVPGIFGGGYQPADNDVLDIAVGVLLVDIEDEAENPVPQFLDRLKAAHVNILDGNRLHHRGLVARRMHRCHRSSRPSDCCFSYNSEELSDHAVDEPANHIVRVGTLTALQLSDHGKRTVNAGGGVAA